MLLDCLGKLLNLAAAQSHQEFVEPLEVATDETLQDFFVEELLDVKDVLSEKHCHAHLDGPLLLFVGGEVRGGRVGQKLQTCSVEVLLVLSAAIVVREDFTEGGIHLRVNVTLFLDLSLHLVEDLQAVVVLAQI